MKKRSSKPQSQTIHEDVPFTMQLQDRRTLFVLVPGEWCGRDRSGELTFKPKAVALLDRVQAMAMKMPVTPTPGFIRTLREAMGLTQSELGARRRGQDHRVSLGARHDAAGTSRIEAPG